MRSIIDTSESLGRFSVAPSSRGYALNISIDPVMYAGTVLAMVLLAVLASAWIARKTVHTPITEALAHT